MPVVESGRDRNEFFIPAIIARLVATNQQNGAAARQKQTERFKVEKATYCNAQMAPKMIRKHCAINADGEKLLENAVTRLGLSARAHDRILKVARTIADLDGAEDVQ